MPVAPEAQVPTQAAPAPALTPDQQKELDAATAQRSLKQGLNFNDLQYQTPGQNIGTQITKEQQDANVNSVNDKIIGQYLGTERDSENPKLGNYTKEQILKEINTPGSYLNSIAKLKLSEIDTSAQGQKNQSDYLARVQQLEGINKGIDAERAARAAMYYTGQASQTPQDLARIYESRRAYDNWLKQNNVKVSDEKTKEAVKPEQASNKPEQTAKTQDQFNPKSFLDALQAVSFEYKKGAKDMPGAGQGRQLGIMAQDLEKAGPVGKSMVETNPTNGVKQVNMGTGFAAILASQAHLNDRLKQIEKRYGKK